MIAGILFLNQSGDTVIQKIYREEIVVGIAEAFRFQVIAAKDSRSPIKSIQSTSFLYIQEADLYIVAVSKSNVDACLVFELLHSLIKICKTYFEGAFDEETVRSNFVLVNEVLDEILDYGYPQTTDLDAVKLLVFQKGHISEERRATLTKITARTTGAMPWRDPNIKYKKNEVYLDVIESVNLLMSATGTLLHCDVSGKIMMKAYLTGSPECKFGINDKLLMQNEQMQGKKARSAAGIALDDVTLHQCVRLGKFESDRTVSFTPPDGEFELMSYRTTEHINLPFRVMSNVKEVSRNRIECEVTVKSDFDPKLFGMGVKITIPTPKNTAVCKILIKGHGKAKYSPDIGGILWKIRRFPGQVEYVLRANIELISNVSIEKKAWSRPPISMEFQVPMFAASGLQIRYLRVVEKSGYNTVKWVRYLTKGGSYLHRI